VLLATGNPYLSSLAASLAAAISVISRFKQRLSLAQRDTVPDHLRVLEAIADGNREKAEKEMNALIRLSFRDIAARHLPRQAQVSPR
jgi:DNA-binding FadR family transcriptional regulator